MDNKLDKILNKLDRLDERQDDMDKTLVRNTVSLEHHIARTNLLEDYVKTEIKPIKKHIDTVKYGFAGIMWLSGALVGLAGFLVILNQLGVLRF
jgi:hypothetical protein